MVRHCYTEETLFPNICHPRVPIRCLLRGRRIEQKYKTSLCFSAVFISYISLGNILIIRLQSNWRRWSWHVCVCLNVSVNARLTDHLTHRISLGVSHGDGTLHIGFDQHDNPLHYRVSKAGVATNPGKVKWSADIFGPTLVSVLHGPVYF